MNSTSKYGIHIDRTGGGVGVKKCLWERQEGSKLKQDQQCLSGNLADKSRISWLEDSRESQEMREYHKFPDKSTNSKPVPVELNVLKYVKHLTMPGT